MIYICIIMDSNKSHSRSINDIDFCIFDIPDLYNNVEPKIGGLIDKREYMIDNCNICNLPPKYCVGYEFHMESFKRFNQKKLKAKL